jgi:fatty-acyl-CoA synthase
MTALIAGPELDLAKLPAYLEGQLPAYARPIFIRLLQHEMEVTGTFKHRKVELVKEGFDPAVLHEPMFWLDPESKSYKPLTPEIYAKLVAGEVKL